MASLTPAPPPPPAHPRGESSPDYYYFVVTVAVIAIMLVLSNVIAFACSPCLLVQNFRRRFLIRRTRAATARDGSRELIPVCQYRKEQAYDTECSVCLTGFMDGEAVRQLPACKHSFHAPCIDMWLYSHSSCPLCRASIATAVTLPPPLRSPRAATPVRREDLMQQQLHVMAEASSMARINVALM